MYPAMEDFALDIMIGKGPSARSVRLDLPPFTLIGATTRAGLLSAPLRDRFGVVSRLEFYSIDELSFIVSRNADLLGIEILGDAAEEVALRCPGNSADCEPSPEAGPRFCPGARRRNYYPRDCQLKRSRCSRWIRADWTASTTRCCSSMITGFRGGPVGLDTIAATIGEESQTIEDVYEPYLLQIGFMQRTPRGRIVTPAAYHHLGLPLPPEQT
jgi:Holliday junction DNA helicase RuvB